MKSLDPVLPHNNPSYDHITSWSDASSEPSRGYDLSRCMTCDRTITATNPRLQKNMMACEACQGDPWRPWQ